MFLKKSEALFFFDGDCGLCQALKRLAQRLDPAGRITYHTLTSAQADQYLGHLGDEERYRASHLVDLERQVFSGADGAIELCRRLPLVAPFIFCYCLLPGHRRLAATLYCWIAENRHRLWPNATCSFEPKDVGVTTKDTAAHSAGAADD